MGDRVGFVGPYNAADSSRVASGGCWLRVPRLLRLALLILPPHLPLLPRHRSCQPWSDSFRISDQPVQPFSRHPPWRRAPPCTESVSDRCLGCSLGCFGSRLGETAERPSEC